MTQTHGRILWPNLPEQYHQISRNAAGAGFVTEFASNPAEVTAEQWAEADAVVGSCPAEHLDKLKKCRIFVKYGVGYDDVDIELILGYLRANATMAQTVLKNSIRAASGRSRDCACASAMQYAILTDRNAIPPKAKDDLAPLIGKYIS